MRIVSVEAVAEKWLVPRLAAFSATHPGIAIEVETNHRGVDPDARDFDAWFAYTGETAASRPVTRREDILLEETLYEEQQLPVCAAVPCSTTWDGTPTGRTGSPARASPRPAGRPAHGSPGRWNRSARACPGRGHPHSRPSPAAAYPACYALAEDHFEFFLLAEQQSPRMVSPAGNR